MLKILFEDQSIIVVEKPPGLESQETKKLEPDMVSEIKKHIHKLSTQMPGKVQPPYVGVIHRLDKPVGGIMVYAKTKEAAAALSRQVQSGMVKKYYLSIICGKLVDNVGNFVDYLLKDEKTNQSRVVEKGTEGSREARLNYRVRDYGTVNGSQVSLVEIELLTGRHHQIRVQFSSRGFPLYGDRKYGKDGTRGGESGKFRGRTGEMPALYAYRLEFYHPVTGEKMSFRKEPGSGAFARFVPEGK